MKTMENILNDITREQLQNATHARKKVGIPKEEKCDVASFELSKDDYVYFLSHADFNLLVHLAYSVTKYKKKFFA